MEIALRKVDSTASFRNEWVVMAQLSPDGLDFLPSARGEQYECDFSPLQLVQGFFRPRKRIRARIDECAFERCKNQMTRGKQDV